MWGHVLGEKSFTLKCRADRNMCGTKNIETLPKFCCNTMHSRRAEIHSTWHWLDAFSLFASPQQRRRVKLIFPGFMQSIFWLVHFSCSCSATLFFFKSSIHFQKQAHRSAFIKTTLFLSLVVFFVHHVRNKFPQRTPHTHTHKYSHGCNIEKQTTHAVCVKPKRTDGNNYI